MATHAMPLPFVGRAHELAILRDRLAAAIAGGGGLVLIGGDPGIGKTALTDAICGQAAERGVFVLTGHCYDRAETPPYGPWIDLFLRYPRSPEVPPPPAFATRGTVGAVPSQMALFAQVQDFLATVTARQPALVAIEDLHWCDPAGLELLRFLAQVAPPLPLLIVATYRGAELTARLTLADLVPLLAREAQPARLDLRPLDAIDVRRLVEQRYRLSAADTTRLAAYLNRRAEGNPLFLSELLRTLEEERILGAGEVGDALGDLTRIGVPPLLRQVIDGRVRRLGAGAQGLLTWAAIIGQEVPLELWATVACAAEDVLLDSVEAAVRARVLDATPDGTRVRFAHALIREALYEGVLPPRRRRMHRHVGEALAGIIAAEPDPDMVAYHFREAGDDRAAAWLVRAGERAAEAYAYETAVARFEDALPLLERDQAQIVGRAEILLRLARLLRQLDVQRAIGHAREALRLADTAGDAALAATARFLLGNDLCLAGHFREGLAAMSAALAAPDAPPEAEAGRLARLDPRSAGPWHRLAGYALHVAVAGGYVEAERHVDTALVEGGRIPEIRYDASNALTNVHTAIGRPAEARAMYAELRSYLWARHEFFLVIQALAYELDRVVIPYLTDQPAARAAVIREGEAAMERLTGRYSGLSPSALLHSVYYLEGRWDDVEPIAMGSISLRQANALALGRIALARGDIHVGWEIVARLIPDGPATEPGDAWFLGALAGQRLASALALATRDFATARGWLDAHDRWLGWNGVLPGRSEGEALWARYYRLAGDVELASQHAERALVLATEPRQPLALLAAHRLLGERDTVADRYDVAASHLRESLALADACQAPYERALTLLACAELHAATGARAEAEAALCETCAICAPLGARAALTRADAIAARLASARPGPLIFPAGLSAREVEVLRLVAQGLTDAQVAERLFLSPRTIHHHLRSIYDKLGVSTRAAATRFAIEHQLG